MRNGIASLLPLALLACSTTPGNAPSLETASEAAAAVVTDACPALLEGTGGTPALKPADQPVRVLAFGDFGDGDQDQLRTARAMVRYDQEHPFDFGLTLGDNFYPTGIADPASPRWQTEWETPYGPLGIRVYATLGNHDYYDPASPAAEMERSRRSASWCLPRPFYTFTAGPVQFFALDTDPIERNAATVRAQIDWLRRELAASQAAWKVVYGHHPIYTNGHHGKNLGYLPQIRSRLLTLLQEQKVDLYLTGHDHDLQILKPDGGVHFVVAGGGGGGADDRPLQTDICREWAAVRDGFAVLEADAETLTVRFVADDGEVLREKRIRKGEAGEDCPRPAPL